MPATGGLRVPNVSTVLAVAAGIAVAVYVVRVFAEPPLPTDDMFYIDAAWAVQNGSYQPPHPGYPFHHYLRWAVVLPLAGLMRMLGMSQAALGLHVLLWSGLVGFLLFRLLRAMGAPTRHAALGALAPLLVPPTIFPPRVLSEGPECAYLLASCVLLVGARARDGLRLVLAGAMLALAVNATMVAVFSSFVPLLAWAFDRHRRATDERERSILRVVLLYGAGAAVTYGGILLAEGLVFGNPLIEYDALTWFHLRHRAESDTAVSWNPDDLGTFVFAFALNLVRQQSRWLLFLGASAAAAGVLVALGWHDRSRRVAATMVVLGVGVYAVLELVGPLVIDKQPLRYLVLPSLLLTAGALIVLGAAVDGVSARPAQLAIVGGLVLTASLLFVSNLRELDPNDPTTHYRDACSAVFEDATMRRRAHPGRWRAVIASEVPGIPYLVWYGLACRVYSSYGLKNVRYVARDVDPAELRAAPVAYYIAWQRPDELPAGLQWTRVRGTAGAPAVFVAEPGR